MREGNANAGHHWACSRDPLAFAAPMWTGLETPREFVSVGRTHNQGAPQWKGPRRHLISILSFSGTENRVLEKLEVGLAGQ